MLFALLFQASMSPSYWVESLHTATHLLNILPSKTLGRHTWLCLAPSLPMITFVFSVALVILIFPLLQPTNLLLVPLCASSLAILLIIKVTAVLISPPTESSSLSMWSSTRLRFPFPSSHSPPTSEEFEFLLEPTNVVPAPIGPAPLLSPTGSPPGALALPCVAVPSPGAPAQPRAASTPSVASTSPLGAALQPLGVSTGCPLRRPAGPDDALCHHTSWRLSQARCAWPHRHCWLAGPWHAARCSFNCCCG